MRLADEPPGPQRLRRVPDGPDLDSEGATGPGAGAGGGEEVYEIHSILDEKRVFIKKNVRLPHLRTMHAPTCGFVGRVCVRGSPAQVPPRY